MASPFHIDEIFPDATAPTPPHRPAGSSAQDLAVTLVADYTLRDRAWLPSAAIVALLGEFDVTSGAARTIISRLARRRVLESSRRGRHTFYRLTEPAAIDLSNGGCSIAAFATTLDPWDGSWTVIVFSMPQDESARRRALRTQLRWMGYAPLYDGVWVSPHPMTAKEEAELAASALGAMTVLRAQHVHLETTATRNPVDAWDLAGIARQYEGFIEHWSPLLPRIAAGKVTGAAAVRARTGVMDTFRRFPVLDPRLSARSLPPDWPRSAARDVFVAVYDGLAGPAQNHVYAVVASVVAGVAEGPPTGIRTHTVAEMHAGVVRGASPTQL